MAIFNSVLSYRVSASPILWQSDIYCFFLGQKQKWPYTPISQRVREGVAARSCISAACIAVPCCRMMLHVVGGKNVAELLNWHATYAERARLSFPSAASATLSPLANLSR